MAGTTTVQHPCALSPVEYWSLRDDYRYHKYLDESAQPPVDHVILEQTEEDGYITRVSSVTPLTNPIPTSLRGMMGCRDGFTFQIREQWWRDKFDAEHPMTFVTEPPVMKDRIKVSGKQWVESDGGTGSVLCFELCVVCQVRGVGSMVSKGIAEGSLQSYKQMPNLALEYCALRRAAAEANEVFDRASRMSHMMEEADETSVSRAASAATLGSRAASAQEVLEDGRKLRARMRWRMALMGVRFRRNLQLQAESAAFRLCIVRIDDPVTSGYPPNRYTTYRLKSTIRGKGRAGATLLETAAMSADENGPTFEVRKRFSDFPPLRAALAAFLPGVELPALPDKRTKNRHAPEVIEERRVTLESFLQAALDHPILATSDDLAAFLEWAPDDVRAPLFARAQACYTTPASRQRLARARVHSLRRRNSSNATPNAATPSVATNDVPSPMHASEGSAREVASARDASSHDTSAPMPGPPPSPALSRAESEFDRATLSREPSTTAPSSRYHSAVQSQTVSRLDSGLSTTSNYAHHQARFSYDDDFDSDGAVRKHASFSDALAAAIVRAAEDAAETVQQTARAHLSSNRSSRLTEESDDVTTQLGVGGRAGSVTSATASTGFADSSERAAALLAARIEAAEAAERVRSRRGPTPLSPAASSSAAQAGPSDEDASVAGRVLVKLEEIEARLRAIEAQKRSSWLWGQVMCCAAPPR